jgi:hypothetical protein
MQFPERGKIMDVLASYWNYAVAAMVVLAGLLVLALVLKAWGSRVRGREGARLAVSEFHEVDKQRRLVLVRRDHVEHLVMIGGPQDIVIETGIDSNAATRETSAFTSSEERIVPTFDGPAAGENRPIPLRPAPRPAVFGDRTPSLKPARAGDTRFAGGPQLELDEDR